MVRDKLYIDQYNANNFSTHAQDLINTLFRHILGIIIHKKLHSLLADIHFIYAVCFLLVAKYSNTYWFVSFPFYPLSTDDQGNTEDWSSSSSSTWGNRDKGCAAAPFCKRRQQEESNIRTTNWHKTKPVKRLRIKTNSEENKDFFYKKIKV